MSRWSLTRKSCVDAFLDAARLRTIRSLLPGQVPAWMTWVAATSKDSADFAEHGAMKRRSCHVYTNQSRVIFCPNTIAYRIALCLSHFCPCHFLHHI